MSGTLKEWLAKAEDDFQAAATLMRARKHPSYDGVCFHAQQSIEKLMKAVLIRRKLVAPRTHDLIELNKLLAKAVSGWKWDEDELRFLNSGAVTFRYPGASAKRTHALRAMRICRRLREALGDFA